MCENNLSNNIFDTYDKNQNVTSEKVGDYYHVEYTYFFLNTF